MQVQEVTVTIDGKETRITHFQFEFKRDIDKVRRPSTPVYIESIKITRDAMEDKGSVIKWLAEESSKTITIKAYTDRNRKNKVSEIKMENAFVVFYDEHYIQHEGEGLIEIFKITAEKVNVDGVPIDEQWPA